MTDELQTALEAARAAGEVLRQQWPQARDVQFKGLRDIVTDADYAAQQVIVERLQARFPEHAILAEEGQHEVSLSGPVPTWVIDPLDGTTNYARYFPTFSVSVALAQDGLVQVGVVYDPLRDETFYAQRGQAAYWQVGGEEPQAMHVTEREDIDDALMGVDWARDPQLRDQVLQALARVATACRSVRAIGSAALGLAYVAAGRLDGYFHLALAPWDLAAGALLVEAAGGRLTRPNGGEWRLGMTQLAVSNPQLHPRLIETLALRAQPAD